MNENMVTVIITAYNADKYIYACLDSIVAQTYSNLEIIVVNDGSTDNTRNIVQECAKKDARIRLINTINSGVSSARNTGIENATGKYITFVDVDDVL